MKLKRKVITEYKYYVNPESVMSPKTIFRAAWSSDNSLPRVWYWQDRVSRPSWHRTQSSLEGCTSITKEDGERMYGTKL